MININALFRNMDLINLQLPRRVATVVTHSDYVTNKHDKWQYVAYDQHHMQLSIK